MAHHRIALAGLIFFCVTLVEFKIRRLQGLSAKYGYKLRLDVVRVVPVSIGIVGSDEFGGKPSRIVGVNRLTVKAYIRLVGKCQKWTDEFCNEVAVARVLFSVRYFSVPKLVIVGGDFEIHFQ